MSKQKNSIDEFIQSTAKAGCTGWCLIIVLAVVVATVCAIVD